jgi:flagellar motor switch protein FliM
MEKILTQEEISALVKGIEDGEVDVNRDKNNESAAVLYDFSKQSHGFPAEMPALILANENFCYSFRQSLFLVLRKEIQVTARPGQTVKYGDFIQSHPAPASLHLFRMDPLRGEAVLVVEPQLIFSFVDIFLGGTRKGIPSAEGHEVTAVEARLIHKVVAQILEDLEKAWNPIQSLTFHYLRGEKNPQMVLIAGPNDWVLTLPFHLEMEQQPLGAVIVCLPLDLLEPVKGNLCEVQKKESSGIDPRWVGRLEDRLKSSEVEVVVEFGKGQVKAQDLLRLKVGDVLPLGKDMAEPLLAKVQGIPKFQGKGGIYGTNKAFQIDGKITGP